MDRVNKWLTLTANIGIVTGLIFLAIELNQNNVLMKANAYQERSDDLIEISAMIVESDVLSSAVAKIDFRRQICKPDELRLDDLTAQELAVLRELLLAQLFRLQNLDRQYHFGLLDSEYHRMAVIGRLQLYLPVWERFEVTQRTLAEAILKSYEGAIPDRCGGSDVLKFGDAT